MKKRIDLHAEMEAAVLAACDGTVSTVDMLEQIAWSAIPFETLVAAAKQTVKDLKESGRFVKKRGKFVQSDAGTEEKQPPPAWHNPTGCDSCEKKPAPTEADIFSRTDTSRPKPRGRK